MGVCHLGTAVPPGPWIVFRHTPQVQSPPPSTIELFSCRDLGSSRPFWVSGTTSWVWAAPSRSQNGRIPPSESVYPDIWSSPTRASPVRHREREIIGPLLPPPSAQFPAPPPPLPHGRYLRAGALAFFFTASAAGALRSDEGFRRRGGRYP